MYFKGDMTRDKALEEDIKVIQDLVRIIRNLKQDYLPAKARPNGKLNYTTST